MVRLLTTLFLFLLSLPAVAGERRVRHLPFSLKGRAALVLHAPSLRGYANGDAVGTWSDLGGSAYDATGSGSVRPTYTTAGHGGMPELTFSGGQRLVNSTFSQSQAFTEILVAAVSPSDTDAAVFTDSYANVQCVFYRGGGGDQNGKWALISSKGITTTSDTNNHVFSLTYSAAAAAIVVDGTSAVTGTMGSSGLSGFSVGNVRGNPTPIVTGGALTGSMQTVIIAAGWSSPLIARVQQSLGYTYRINTK